MSLRTIARVALIFGSLAVITALVYNFPPVNRRLSWRVDFALTYLRGVVRPVEPIPTPLPQPNVQVRWLPTPNANDLTSIQEEPTPTSGPPPTPTPTPTPLPEAVSLPPPEWEKQDINNCGPASLSMYLRFYGWQGDQFTISELIKPRREDRNVNVEEMDYYVRTRAGWLNVEYRVGGDIETLKQLLAAGIPVLIEEGFLMDEVFWPNDDRWAGHYLLLTGYDDNAGAFTAHDSFRGPDMVFPYDTLDKNWQAFNRVYLLVYHPAQDDLVRSLLGSQWDVEANRQHALEVALEETERDPDNAFAWFNLGTNLVYFGRYSEAARAYDQARTLGLPQRMLRYQFGPFFAYFHTGRMDDLFALTGYALERTPNSEEALLWHGWGLYRQGENTKAKEYFRMALEANPNHYDAQYALEFVQANP